MNGPVRVVVVRTAALDTRRGAVRWSRDARVACPASTHTEIKIGLPKLTTLDADDDTDATGDGALDCGSFSRQFFFSTGRRAHCFDERWLVWHEIRRNRS